jgi:hypothetical protein
MGILLQILTMFGPVLAKGISAALDKAINSWKSTAMSVPWAAAAVETMQLMGCDLGLAQGSVVAIAAALPGILATDADKIGPSIIGAMKAKVIEMKHSAQVLADAEAAQEKARKDFNIK